jgi:hypothetical protein
VVKQAVERMNLKSGEDTNGRRKLTDHCPRLI